jgi:hypothetical protein
MKKQILLIVMTLCAMSAMAVSLPNKSYNSYANRTSNSGAYTLGIGTQFLNQAVVGAYNGECDQYREGGNLWTGDVSACANCCFTNYVCGEEDWDCLDARGLCMDNCGEPLGGLPLDAPTAFLFAMIAAYGAFAVYRRKMQQV